MHNGSIYGMNPYIMGPPGCGGCCNDYARFKVVADKGGLGCCNEEVGNIKYVRKDRSVWIYDPCDPNAVGCGWVCIFSGVSMYDLVDNLDGSFTLTENGEPKTTIDMNPYFQKYFRHNILSKTVTLTNGDGATVDLYDKSYIDGEISRINNAISNIQGDITDIQGDITNIQGDITDIQGDITNIQGDITDIHGNLGDKIESYTMGYSDTNTVSSSIRGSVTGLHTVTLDVSDLHNKISAVETTLMGNVLKTAVQSSDGYFSDTVDLSSISGGGGTISPTLEEVMRNGDNRVVFQGSEVSGSSETRIEYISYTDDTPIPVNGGFTFSAAIKDGAVGGSGGVLADSEIKSNAYFASLTAASSQTTTPTYRNYMTVEVRNNAVSGDNKILLSGSSTKSVGSAINRIEIYPPKAVSDGEITGNTNTGIIMRTDDGQDIALNPSGQLLYSGVEVATVHDITALRGELQNLQTQIQEMTQLYNDMKKTT